MIITTANQWMLEWHNLNSLCVWCVQMSIVKGEECVLLDNSRRTRWRVRNSAGVEGLVPAICFYIPPPNKDAESLAKTCVFRHL